MSDIFEQLVIQRLDDIKEDMNRASDRHDSNLRKLFELHEAHTQSDVEQFKHIDGQFNDAAVVAAETKGAAKATAKFWGIVVATPGSITGLIWAIWKFLEHIHYIR